MIVTSHITMLMLGDSLGMCRLVLGLKNASVANRGSIYHTAAIEAATSSLSRSRHQPSTNQACLSRRHTAPWLRRPALAGVAVRRGRSGLKTENDEPGLFMIEVSETRLLIGFSNSL